MLQMRSELFYQVELCETLDYINPSYSCTLPQRWTRQLHSIPFASFPFSFSVSKVTPVIAKIGWLTLVVMLSEDDRTITCTYVAYSLYASYAVSYLHPVLKLPFILQSIEENLPPGYNVVTINDNSPHIDYSAAWDLTFVPQQGKPSPGHTFHSTAVINSNLTVHFNGA